MKNQKIPQTDMTVSQICLGTMTFGTPVPEAEAIRIVHWAMDHGINFIDTANIYEGYRRYLGSPGGVAEAILGKALEGRRERAVLATKVGNPVGPGPEDRGLGRSHIFRECDRSLARLKTDQVDIYYMHRTDPDTPVAESIRAFVDLIHAGKVRHWGISNFDAHDTREVLETCDDNGWARPVVHQPPYSLLKRDIESDLLPLCRREEVAVVPYQVLQGGLLTGKYRGSPSPPAGSRGAEKPEWLPMLHDPELQRQIEELDAKAEAQGLTLFDYVIRTTANTPGMTSILLGVKNTKQMADAIRALESG